MKCVKCEIETSNGKTYRFYYGKRGATDFPGTRFTRTKFAVDGSEDAYLCSNCLDGSIERRARTTAAAVFGLLLALSLIRLMMGPAAKGSELETIVGFPTAFMGACVVYLGIRSWKKGKQREEEGQKVAIRVRKPALLALGYDSFFTLNEYSRLI